jgi:hypothetical protein
MEAALAKTSLSQVAHATDGFTHGRVLTSLPRDKGHNCPLKKRTG